MKANILKNKAILLRKKGFSFREVSEKLGISKSTASLWLRDVKLPKNAKKRIEKLGDIGRRKAIESNKKAREKRDKAIREKVGHLFSGNKLRINPKIVCALLYWCEGTKHKTNSSVSFMNADPEMIRYFMKVFRTAFDINEKKLRGLVHLHAYHDVRNQIGYWSDVSGIPTSQFNRSYIKKNTGKNLRENYPGCLSVRYSDVKIYKEIMFTIEKLLQI